MAAHIFSGLTHEHESLGVGDDLGGVEGLFKVIYELFLVAAEGLFLRTSDDFTGTNALFFQGRQAPGEDGLPDQGDYGRGR